MTLEGQNAVHVCAQVLLKIQALVTLERSIWVYLAAKRCIAVILHALNSFGQEVIMSLVAPAAGGLENVAVGFCMRKLCSNYFGNPWPRFSKNKKTGNIGDWRR